MSTSIDWSGSSHRLFYQWKPNVWSRKNKENGWNIYCQCSGFILAFFCVCCKRNNKTEALTEVLFVYKLQATETNKILIDSSGIELASFSGEEKKSFNGIFMRFSIVNLTIKSPFFMFTGNRRHILQKTKQPKSLEFICMPILVV